MIRYHQPVTNPSPHPRHPQKHPSLSFLRVTAVLAVLCRAETSNNPPGLPGWAVLELMVCFDCDASNEVSSAPKYHNYRMEELYPSNWKVFFANKSELGWWQWWYYRVRRVRRFRYGNITVARAGSSPELEEYEIQLHLQPLVSSSLL